MSDDYKENITPLEAQSSESTTGSGGSIKDIDYVRPAEVAIKIFIMVIVLLLSGFFARMQKLLEYNIFLLQYLPV